MFSTLNDVGIHQLSRGPFRWSVSFHRFVTGSPAGILAFDHFSEAPGRGGALGPTWGEAGAVGPACVVSSERRTWARGGKDVPGRILAVGSEGGGWVVPGACMFETSGPPWLGRRVMTGHDTSSHHGLG